MSLVTTAGDGPVLTIELNRPSARNALSVELCDAVVEAFGQAALDDEARVIVLGGAGPVFCSGADFAAFSGPKGVDFLQSFERMLAAVGSHPLPTIARIHGAALGGGLQLATVCDFRVCETGARLGIPSSRLGVVVNLENVERLVHLVGVARAKEVLLTGKTFSGREAVASGLVSEACGPEDLGPAVERMALAIASLAPLSVQGAKRAMRVITEEHSVRKLNPRAALGVDALVAEAYASEDLEEGIRAMNEKRRPDFKGS